ncbi:MAG: hypothetical protein ACRDNO_30500, partial [Trebonia sp.]
ALTARAIARAALASSAAPPDRAPDAATAALGLIGRGQGKPGPVPRRVAALLVPPPGLSPWLIAAAVGLVAVSGASALEAARNLHQLI